MNCAMNIIKYRISLYIAVYIYLGFPENEKKCRWNFYI